MPFNEFYKIFGCYISLTHTLCKVHNNVEAKVKHKRIYNEAEFKRKKKRKNLIHGLLLDN